jgi:glycosyltransferase involved in cell wall biosynthesis
LEKYGLRGSYVLSISTLQPRKNYINMIRAYATVVASRPALKYVIVGRKGWYYEEIFKEVERLNLQDKVLFLGFLPDEELSVIMKNAKAILYVSKDEGFGFPAVQAAINKIPVVLSDIPVFRELKYSDSFIYVNPNNLEEIAASIRAAIASRPSTVSDDFRGYYSWENTVRSLLSIVYRS